MTYLPHQERVVEEKEDLDELIWSLQKFIDSHYIFPTLPEAEQARLRKQLGIQKDYSQVLAERIAAFTN